MIHSTLTNNIRKPQGKAYLYFELWLQELEIDQRFHTKIKLHQFFQK